ncbi:MAG TPA: peptidoglycan DD-metalloendopeptidase family protein [Candidatus Thalassarchaeaceae archaeon]|jgi:murein DD-endopeptidase MepM/ murein hydrolase activator NlpD|nr:peptidase M23 [Euryarchaeota archaeon]MBJ09181.1 peptidase M23 [Euryarchaeota archaeon]DAC43413.1 MAG TPA: peptidase M23 [Candidatus Poseidoniales archaeon]HII90159.1 peptidoglycan DD-metalloendopeptidase family protein [Candidatus Thalassarchaeaceae archaeon]|tara:strand:- start:789 stop:1370 length:582 start_codon:yes stop_codon:yes gene_type:complete
MVDWGSMDFHPVVHLPDEYEVRDFTSGDYSPSKYEFDIGRYDELRPGMYSTELFAGERFLHVGIDIGGPVGTPCMAFMDGEISHFGYNPAAGDYGNVVITRHEIGGVLVWALYGHLDAASIEGKWVGQKVNAGEVIAWFGAFDENGGWDPHLHFQLSLVEPETHDLPGVVAPEDRMNALAIYPDPRNVLGPLY